jgi:hypothetical protein
MRGLDSLELGNVFLFFAGIAIRVVLQSELAILLLDFFASRGSG